MRKIEDDIFLAGVDIPEGEYLIERNWDGGISITVSKDEDMVNSIFELYEDYGSFIVQVKKYEYLQLDGCTATILEKNTKINQNNGFFSEKIGTTLKCGTYSISPLDKDDWSEYIIYNSARYLPENEIKSKSLDHSVIDEFCDGQYVLFKNCKISEIEQASLKNSAFVKKETNQEKVQTKRRGNIMLDKENGIYPSGIYVIGETIEKGNYLLQSNGNGYIAFYASYNDFIKREIASNNCFSDDFHVPLLGDGIVVEITGCTIKKI